MQLLDCLGNLCAAMALRGRDSHEDRGARSPSRPETKTIPLRGRKTWRRQTFIESSWVDYSGANHILLDGVRTRWETAPMRSYDMRATMLADALAGPAPLTFWQIQAALYGASRAQGRARPFRSDGRLPLNQCGPPCDRPRRTTGNLATPGQGTIRCPPLKHSRRDPYRATGCSWPCGPFAVACAAGKPKLQSQSVSGLKVVEVRIEFDRFAQVGRGFLVVA